ncbi:hypothetical protein [Coxiella endosymbiont of Amblyomma nuttalli]|uniref:hypothetical protein n=1 Tax=Coxiella endosymbiont of Amblyomma nuttalli TaxID=2749996 RepID=UPI001BA52165|nr:hypothetical protein [Coxiella endosymbiont of Amblyomma nuttalli]QTS83601.1 hypothetical protein CEAn_00052 [Coxiella endosymbiont of Amblyomma nuttalli]
MVKDYAKHSSYQTRPGIRRGTFLIFGVCIVAFILALIFYHQKSNRIHSKNKTVYSATIPKSAFYAPAASKLQFSFYTILPKMQVPIPKSEK